MHQHWSRRMTWLKTGRRFQSASGIDPRRELKFIDNEFIGNLTLIQDDLLDCDFEGWEFVAGLRSVFYNNGKRRLEKDLYPC
jgi:hypothetical protein